MAFSAALKQQLKDEIKAELMEELQMMIIAQFTDLNKTKSEPASTFSLKLKSNTEWDKLEGSKPAYDIFTKWYAKQQGYRHPRHAFNSLCKHHGIVSIERDGNGVAQVKAGKKFWKL